MFKVRRLFSTGKRGSTQGPTESPALPAHVDSAAVAVGTASVHMPPRLAIPPSLHPLPYERILIAVSDRGLLLRPDTESPDAHVRIAWGKAATLESIDNSGDTEDWSEAVFIYGIVGILRLFKGAQWLSAL